jgi:hypothetical protein
MDAFIAQAKTLASQVDQAGRMKLEAALREVLYSLETPGDTMWRLYDQVSDISLLQEDANSMYRTCNWL